MNCILPLFLIILNYLAGSISSAIIIAKYVKGVDIRKIGHKKAGGSNVMQHIGIKWGLLVGIFDIVKGVPILLLAKYLNVDDLWLPFIAISAVAGHNWPIWFNFSGGRGLATIIGCMVILTPSYSVLPIIIFLSSVVPSLLKVKKNIDLKFISSPVLTLVALGVYLFLTLQSEAIYDDLYAYLIIFIMIFRRVTARFEEYKDDKFNKVELFFSRLIFDNSEGF